MLEFYSGAAELLGRFTEGFSLRRSQRGGLCFAIARLNIRQTTGP